MRKGKILIKCYPDNHDIIGVTTKTLIAKPKEQVPVSVISLVLNIIQYY